jgi:hypothetical protein
MSESFEQWLVREIPPGTVISNPLWWAPKIRQALQSGEPVVLERFDAHLEIEYDEVKIVIDPDPEGSLVYYDNVVRAMQSTPQPPTTKPIAAVKGWFHGECVVQALDPALAIPVGTALYAAPQPVVPDEFVKVSSDFIRDAVRDLKEVQMRLIQCGTYANPQLTVRICLDRTLEALLSAGKGTDRG